MNWIFKRIGGILIGVSLIGCLLVFIFYAPPIYYIKTSISAASLILVGFTCWYVLLTRIFKIEFGKRIKEFLEGLAFILWGVSAITSGICSTILNDIVVMLFVFDMAHTCY